jgi:precorrin-6B C5,15-methyltransferase / cobalt-precorrin-6B C5,C15-methyltransferase
MRDMPTANEPVVETFSTHSAASMRWLSIVGIGEDGLDGLSAAARGLIEGAEMVFGGRRHLALVAPLIRGAARAWPSPFDGAADEVGRHRGRPVCVLASGDPFHYGVGAVLARHIDPREMIVLPAPSAFSLAAARLGWSLPDTVQLSLHGRSLDLIRSHLQPGARILVLTSGEDGPAALAQLLARSGFGETRLTILEALGGPRERVRSATAAGFALAAVDTLNTVALAIEAGADARILPLSCGIPDHLFEHDGQISKREVRAIVLSSLAPRRGELLWDIGAGSGAVAIEWMLRDPSLRAIALERRADRAARIVRNAAACGVPALQVVTAAAPAACAELPKPDAIFIGGGASEPGVLDAAARALRPGGRLVVNAITLASETLLLNRHAVLGGELLRLAISRAEPLGEKLAWRAAMPVTQWQWTKP